MAHLRNRQVDSLFERLVKFSPLIGVFGHRQVGKTTYTASAAKKYYTLDDEDTKRSVALDAKSFIRQQKQFPVVIDECQLEPSLFPALKEQVRLHKRPGQFILTGSVRFTSTKTSRESLAGRLATLELYPLILSEIRGTPLPVLLPQLLRQKAFSNSTLDAFQGFSDLHAVEKDLNRYLTQGGLPGLCFIREERLRREALDSLHRLILDRDLRLVVETKLSLDTLSRFLGYLARNGHEIYNASEVKRKLGLAHQTQKSLLLALESIFVIRRIPVSGRQGEVILFEDQYEEYSLSDGKHSLATQVTSALYRNIRAQFQYRLGESASFESYRSPYGARVPLVLRSASQTLGLIVLDEDKPALSQTRSADSFLRKEANAKVLYVAPHSRRAEIVDDRSLLCSAAHLLA